MFEDLIPAASGQTPAPPPGMFDDLVPAEAVSVTENRIVLEGDGARAVVRRGHDRARKTWVLTAYETPARRRED
jgi:hypothetical protein